MSTSSPGDTLALAARLARGLKGGEILLLDGPIGAGKTVFVQGLARALGMRRRPVSASFGLMREYRSPRARLFHLDLFRLGETDMANFGFEDILAERGAIMAVEWPGPLERLLPDDRLSVGIALAGGDRRRIEFRAGGPSSAALLERL